MKKLIIELLSYHKRCRASGSTEPRYCRSKAINCFFIMLAIGCFTFARSSTIWDYGPTTGTFSGSVLNQHGFQTAADRVSFNADTLINGLSYFTNASALDGTNFDFQILADSGGTPGIILFEWSEDYDSFALAGSFSGTDIYAATFSFNPLLLQAETAYWIGASGNGFDAHQALVSQPGDGLVALFSGSGFAGLFPGGDQMFQLSGEAVPEPPSVVLCFVGFLTFIFTASYRNFGCSRWNAAAVAVYSAACDKSELSRG